MKIINGHYVYTDGDIDTPETTKDGNGSGAVNCCMLCGGEGELSGHCTLTVPREIQTDDMVAVPRGLLASLGYIVRNSSSVGGQTHKLLKEFQLAPALIGGRDGKDS